MLILTRRIGEVLRIGDDVQVKVLKVNGTQVSIGIEAPKSVAVHREKIYQRIQAEKAVPPVHLAEDERREPRERPVSRQTGFEE